MNNIKGSKEFTQKAGLIFAEKRSFHNRDLTKSWNAINAFWIPIRDETNNLLLKGEELSKLPAAAGSRSIRKMFKKHVDSLDRKIHESSGRVNRNLQHKRSLAVRKQQRLKRAGKNSSEQDSVISLYKALEGCLVRLGRIPQLLYCEILGCDSISITTSSLPPHPSVGPTEIDPTTSETTSSGITEITEFETTEQYEPTSDISSTSNTEEGRTDPIEGEPTTIQAGISEVDESSISPEED